MTSSTKREISQDCAQELYKKFQLVVNFFDEYLGKSWRSKENVAQGNEVEVALKNIKDMISPLVNIEDMIHPEQQVSYEEMLDAIGKYGWVEYYRGNCIRQEWVEQRLPYDRMICSVEDVYRDLPKNE